MRISEVEERTGLTRSNIRFYEKEKLIKPERDERNSYRIYSEQNVADIQKIAYLRTLGISVEDIHRVINGKIALGALIAKQETQLDDRIAEMTDARELCRRMLAEDEINYENMNIEDYVSELPGYRQSVAQLLKLDSIGFLHLWGGFTVWLVIVLISAAAALMMFPHLPREIPIQWRGNSVSSAVSKWFIFAYPAACLVIRMLLKPFIRVRLQRLAIFHDVVTDYLTNSFCLVVLSVELFTFFYVSGLTVSVAVLLWIDAAVIGGLLLTAWHKMTQ